MTRPDCAVMCNLINTHTHTHTHTQRERERERPVHVIFSKFLTTGTFHFPSAHHFPEKEHFFYESGIRTVVDANVLVRIVCVCVCALCVFIKLHITAQSGPVIPVILCHSH